MNFTSLYKVNGTFFRGIMVSTFITNISTNYLLVEENSFQRERKMISYSFVLSTTKSSYFLFIEPWTCMTMTSIQLTSCWILRITNFVIKWWCINMSWTGKIKISIISVLDELTLITWGLFPCSYFDLTPQLKLMTFMHFPTWILSKWWRENASEIIKVIV